MDISGQRAKSLNEFYYVITVCDQAREQCPAFPGETLHLP